MPAAWVTTRTSAICSAILNLADQSSPDLEREAQVLAFDELEDQPVTLLVFDVVVDAADVRVIELGEDLRFAQRSGSSIPPAGAARNGPPSARLDV